MARSSVFRSPLSNPAMTPNNFVHVVCEGKSERNYLAALNRLFRDSGIGVTLVYPKPQKRGREDGGGHFKVIQRAYREYVGSNRNIHPWVWVDWDVYLRNDQHCRELYESRAAGIPAFLFSICNFEDFLVLHSSRERVMDWVQICSEHQHFDLPMQAEKYMPLFKRQFPEYRKGSLPDSLVMLGNGQIANALTHSLDPGIPLKCDFIEHLAHFIMNNRPEAGWPWNVIRQNA